MKCTKVTEMLESIPKLEASGDIKTKDKLFREIINTVGSYIIEADVLRVAVVINSHIWIIEQETEFSHPDEVLSELEIHAANIVNTEFPEDEETSKHPVLNFISGVFNKLCSRNLPPIPELPKKAEPDEGSFAEVQTVNLNEDSRESNVEIKVDDKTISTDAIKELDKLF